MTLGETLKCFRMRSWLSKEDLAGASGIPSERIAEYEHDLHPSILPTDMSSLANALGLRSNDLTADSPELLKRSVIDDELESFAMKFPSFCISPYRAAAAIDTVCLANNHDLHDPSSTKFIPPIPHGKYFEYVHGLNLQDAVRFLAAFSLIYITRTKDEREPLTFGKCVNKAALITGIPLQATGIYTLYRRMALLYMLYENIGLSRKTGYAEAQDRINQAISQLKQEDIT